jgi:hypothetical protein
MTFSDNDVLNLTIILFPHYCLLLIRVLSGPVKHGGIKKVLPLAPEGNRRSSFVVNEDSNNSKCTLDLSNRRIFWMLRFNVNVSFVNRGDISRGDQLAVSIIH